MSNRITFWASDCLFEFHPFSSLTNSLIHFFLNSLVCFLLSTFSRAKWGIRVYDGSDNFAVGVAARRHTSWRTRTKLRPDPQSARKFEPALSKLSHLIELETDSSGSGVRSQSYELSPSRHAPRRKLHGLPYQARVLKRWHQVRRLPRRHS